MYWRGKEKRSAPSAVNKSEADGDVEVTKLKLHCGDKEKCSEYCGVMLRSGKIAKMLKLPDRYERGRTLFVKM